MAKEVSGKNIAAPLNPINHFFCPGIGFTWINATLQLETVAGIQQSSTNCQGVPIGDRVVLLLSQRDNDN